MIRRTLQQSVSFCFGLLVLLVVSTALVGSFPEPPPEEKKDKAAPEAEKNAEERIRREAESLIRGIEMEIRSGGKWTKVEWIEKPLLFYSEHTRGNDRGSVWGWGQKGRPVALLELFQDLNNRTSWVFAITNTSGGKLRAGRAEAPWWGENDSAAELKDVPGAPAPAAEAIVRQRQLKMLTQKFTAHEFWDPDNSRYELRMLTRPLYTYRDEGSGILDGGLFMFANGTNPEIPLFIEARTDPKHRSKSVWQYAVGRTSHAELHIEYEGKEIFQAPRQDRPSDPSKPYWAGRLKADLDADPKKP